jgi:pre-mRNA 3'-end-processing factor FIP1
LCCAELCRSVGDALPGGAGAGSAAGRGGPVFGAGARGSGLLANLPQAARSGKSVLELDIAELEEKPWRKPGADLSDYFNYGFNEETWRAYCQKQQAMRSEQASAGRIRVYESQKPDLRADLPPELLHASIAAAASSPSPSSSQPPVAAPRLVPKPAARQPSATVAAVAAPSGGNSGAPAATHRRRPRDADDSVIQLVAAAPPGSLPSPERQSMTTAPASPPRISEMEHPRPAGASSGTSGSGSGRSSQARQPPLAPRRERSPSGRSAGRDPRDRDSGRSFRERERDGRDHRSPAHATLVEHRDEAVSLSRERSQERRDEREHFPRREEKRESSRLSSRRSPERRDDRDHKRAPDPRDEDARAKRRK